jgi:hypothetical protein
MHLAAGCDLTPALPTATMRTVIRLALAALVFCSTLVATFAPTPFGALEPRGLTLAVQAVDLGLDCAPVDDQGEWRPHHGVSTSITDGIWKWRSVHALAIANTIAFDGHVVAGRTGTPDARVARAPAYLLHTPLLI